jgi:SSS family solute:Na+ symporter
MIAAKASDPRGSARTDRCATEAGRPMLDLAIIAAYFVVIMAVGVVSRTRAGASAEDYFIASRRLRWPSIALSTIATNIHAGHFLGIAGSAYLYGLAQANLEINAVFGLLLAAFVFVPLYLKQRVVTITQFFEARLGMRVATAYSVLTMVLYGFLYLGTALFWGAYAADALFPAQTALIHADPATRVMVMMVALGLFSATYTWLGGLTAVVRTDAVQLMLLVGGGVVLTVLAVREAGGWPALQASGLMHLHLPADHPKLPWTAIGAMLLLNLNYWGANQIILQRALAARSLRDAQLGLLAGGVLKYVTAAITTLPAIALAMILRERPLDDPDLAYPTLVNLLLPAGLRGLVLCGLFASLMSTVDSIFNSVSTLWSVDIYKRRLRPAATDAQVIAMGRRAIVATLGTGLAFGFFQVHVKYSDPAFALTHWFNDMSYYIKVGFVILVAAAVFLRGARPGLVLAMMVATIGVKLALETAFPGAAYFNITALTILIGFAVVAGEAWARTRQAARWSELWCAADRAAARAGIGLAASLVAVQSVFH